MDIVSLVNKGTHDERNILGQCKLCISKCASFVLCFLILYFKIYGKILEKHGLKSFLWPESAISLKNELLYFCCFNR